MLAVGLATLGTSLALPLAPAVGEDPAPLPVAGAPSSGTPAGQPTAPPTPAPQPQPPPSTADPPPAAPPSQPASPGGPASAAPAAAASASPPATARASGDPSVSIVGANPNAFAFSPGSITVRAGEAVTWTNSSSAAEGHTVTGNGFDSGNLHQGQTYTHTFNAPGTFRYVCQIHTSMEGSVVVTAASSPGRGGGGGGAGGSGAGPTTAAASGGGGSGTGTASTGPGSESAAGASPDAAGSSTQLPSTGMPVGPPLAAAALLIGAGLLARRLARAR